MPPRLAHKKSRNGCRRCKARRVKCDEVHPVCTNCSRHKVPCEYVSIKSDTKPTHPPEPPKLCPSLLNRIQPLAFDQGQGWDCPHADEPDNPDAAFGPNTRRLLELRLLHWFVTVVVNTFPSSQSPTAQDVWKINAAQLAFEHPFLLNSILALAALHLTSEPDDARGILLPRNDDKSFFGPTQSVTVPDSRNDFIDYAKVHRIYLHLAIGQQKDAVANINSENANAIFLSTILLQYHAFRQGREERSVYSPPLQWLRMAKAIISISKIARPLAIKNSVIDLLAYRPDEPDFLDLETVFNPDNYINNPAFVALLDWEKHSEPGFDEDTRKVYEMVVAYVAGSWRGILNHEAQRVIFRRIMSLGIMCPPRFIDFVEQRRPRALAILAHHFAMAKIADDHWLFRGFAKREVEGIAGLLPHSWRWAMEWPENVLHHGVVDVAPATMSPSQKDFLRAQTSKNA